jgi:hypothetical protein
MPISLLNASTDIVNADINSGNVTLVMTSYSISSIDRMGSAFRFTKYATHELIDTFSSIFSVNDIQNRVSEPIWRFF